jgi:WD40 repeat protein
MADITNQLQAAAGAAGGGVGGSYLLVTAFNKVALLDHTTPGTLTSAATYSIGVNFAQGADFSPDGGYVALGGTTSSAVIKLLTRTTPSTLTFATTYTCAGANVTFNDISFSPDSDYIAVGTNSSTAEITLLNHTTPGSLSLATTYNIIGNSAARSVDFSPDGNYLVVGASWTSDNPTITLLDHSTPGSLSFSATYYTGFANNVHAAFFSPDGNYIACNQTPSVFGTLNAFVLLNHTTPGSLSLATTYALSNPDNSVAQGCSWSPDGAYIALGSWISGGTATLTLLSHTAGTVSFAATYQTGYSSALGMAFSPDGNYIAASGTTNGTSGGTEAVVLLNHTAGSLSLATTYSNNLGYAGTLVWSPD